MVQKVKDYTKGFLNRHKWLKAFLYWNGWPMAIIAFFVLQLFAGDIIYYSAWLWLWFASPFLPEAILKHYLSMLGELRALKQLNISPASIACIGALALLLIDRNHDGAPDIKEKELDKGCEPHPLRQEEKRLQ